MPCPFPLEYQAASSQARLKSCWALPGKSTFLEPTHPSTDSGGRRPLPDGGRTSRRTALLLYSLSFSLPSCTHVSRLLRYCLYLSSLSRFVPVPFSVFISLETCSLRGSTDPTGVPAKGGLKGISIKFIIKNNCHSVISSQASSFCKSPHLNPREK